jgi:hypothetical protein
MSGTCLMTDGFATHDWGFSPDHINHEKVKTVCSTLKDMGITLWFDSERMVHDNIQNQMTSAIENTKSVVAFITERYQTKVNSMDPHDACYFEFNFACFRLTNRRIIPVVMEKSMLNQKEWKGRLAAELGNHLFIDMTEAMEKVDANPADNGLLKQKCQEIHDRIVKIKSNTYLSVNASTSSVEDGERFIQLTEQLDWIKEAFDEMDTKYHGTIVAQFQQIVTFLAKQPMANRILQSLDYEVIINKIFNWKGSAAVVVNSPSLKFLSLSQKDDNKENSMEIMKSFLLILCEGQSELILTILTTLNRLLLKEETTTVPATPSTPTSPSSVVPSTFLDFLTSCGIVKIMKFLLLNLPLKTKGNKVIEFQLQSALFLLMKSLTKNKENKDIFLEWGSVCVNPGNTDIPQNSETTPVTYVISGKCVNALSETIFTPLESHHDYDEWNQLDESSLMLLFHGFKDHMNDSEVMDSLLSAISVVVKDDANCERLGNLNLTEFLIKAMDVYWNHPTNEYKNAPIALKLLQVMNFLESNEKNSMIPVIDVLVVSLLGVLNSFPFMKEFKPDSFDAVIAKANRSFFT